MARVFTREMSARFWNAWRKILRWPLSPKPVSKTSQTGAPTVLLPHAGTPLTPGSTKGMAKALGASAACAFCAKNAPECPVNARLGE